MENTMPKNDPTPNDDNEIDFDEIDFDDIDPLPTEATDIEEGEYATTDVPPVGLIDLIANQNASDARKEIFRSLYNKVGEKINSIKADIRKGASPETE